MMKTNKLTWTGDIKAAAEAVGFEAGGYFNDRFVGSRRIKFVAFGRDGELTDGDLVLMQDVIQKRRPHLNVSVSRYNGMYGNVTVHYRPKVGTVMDHTAKV
jgi:hypothetical protein